MLGPTAEQTQLEEKTTQYSILHKKFQDSIKTYLLKNVIVGSDVYSSYDFSEVYEHKPKEISEYEALIKRRNRLPYMESIYHGKLDEEIAKNDSSIAAKKAFIKEHRIHSTFEVGHIFKSSSPKSHHVAEYVFYHFPNGKVKDLTVSYSLKLSPKHLSVYESYYHNRAIFYNNGEADYQFYKKVERQLAKEENKSAFLNQVVMIIGSIKTNGSIIPEKIIPKIIDQNYPNKVASKIFIRKAAQEGFASDNITTASYEIDVTFADEQTTLQLDDWFRIIK